MTLKDLPKEISRAILAWYPHYKNKTLKEIREDLDSKLPTLRESAKVTKSDGFIKQLDRAAWTYVEINYYLKKDQSLIS